MLPASGASHGPQPTEHPWTQSTQHPMDHSLHSIPWATEYRTPMGHSLQSIHGPQSTEHPWDHPRRHPVDHSPHSIYGPQSTHAPGPDLQCIPWATVYSASHRPDARHPMGHSLQSIQGPQSTHNIPWTLIYRASMDHSLQSIHGSHPTEHPVDHSPHIPWTTV